MFPTVQYDRYFADCEPAKPEPAPARLERNMSAYPMALLAVGSIYMAAGMCGAFPTGDRYVQYGAVIAFLLMFGGPQLMIYRLFCSVEESYAVIPLGWVRPLWRAVCAEFRPVVESLKGK